MVRALHANVETFKLERQDQWEQQHCGHQCMDTLLVFTVLAAGFSKKKDMHIIGRGIGTSTIGDWRLTATHHLQEQAAKNYDQSQSDRSSRLLQVSRLGFCIWNSHEVEHERVTLHRHCLLTENLYDETKGNHIFPNQGKCMSVTQEPAKFGLKCNCTHL
jgi:hypothetical protein